MKLSELKEMLEKELGDKAHMLEIYEQNLIALTIKETADKAVELATKALKDKIKELGEKND